MAAPVPLLPKKMPRGLRLDLSWSDVIPDASTPKSEGGFAQVSRVFWNGCAFALKQPKVKVTLTKRDVREFMAEVQVQGRVRHPSCVAIFGVCLQPDSPFILMEWVGGGDVFTKLGDEALLPRQRLTCVRQVASALDYLHACRIVHGDIKSLNVLLSASGSAKLCDFGGAVQLLTTIVSSASGAAGGNAAMTLAWCAPELFTGGSKTTATDVYAFGIFMWECYTGEVPFRGVNPGLVGDQVMRGVRPALPAALIDGFPPEFVVLMRVRALCGSFFLVPESRALRRSVCIRTLPGGLVPVKCSVVLWLWTPPPDPASRCRSTDATRRRPLTCCPVFNAACKRSRRSPAPRLRPCWPTWSKHHPA
jgi:serine/threonine protein kinase